MCRNIKTLFNFEPPATDEEIQASALQFVRKLSGFNKPSKANEAAFALAVEQVSEAATTLVRSLVTQAPPRDRDIERAKAMAEAAKRFHESVMRPDRVFAIKFASLYPLYVKKAESKKRTKAEVDRVLCWLTGYTQAGLKKQIERESDLEVFFSQAPALHPNSALIKGVVCGIRVENIEDPLMRKIRYMDKLIDELAKGKAMEKILRQAVIVAGLALALPFASAAEHHGHWSYSGSGGPAHWAALEEDYHTCGDGALQSPIDIRDASVQKTGLPGIVFHYEPSKLKIIDNGHTIQVAYAPGSSITVGDKQYELVQFHFHKPSEEEINGKRFDMVAHLVHRDATGHLAVIAVLLTEGDTDNAVVETLWHNLPKTKETEMDVDAATIDAAKLLPADHAYYTFSGSLTTPPCSEGVTWYVLQHPTVVSKEEVARFGKLYRNNARPVQPAHGREVDTGG